ncbi:MAG: AraC family transcriptional regulator [bacterium]
MRDRDEYTVQSGDPDLTGLPEIVMFGDARHLRAEQRLGPHYNPGIELCLSRSGVYRWNVEGRAVEIRPGELSLTRPWQEHSAQNSALGPGRLAWIILAAGGSRGSLDAPLLEPLLGPDAAPVLRAFSESSRSYLGPSPQAVEVFDRLRKEVPCEPASGHGRSAADHPRPRAVGRTATIRADLARLLVLVARCLTEDSPAAAERDPIPPAVMRVLARVADEPQEPWTAADMAADAGLGLTAFTEWCRRATGRSPRWYVLASRLERARSMLASTSAPVTHIALENGFSSSQHFSSAFRKLYGESPSRFRARLRGPR